MYYKFVSTSYRCQIIQLVNSDLIINLHHLKKKVYISQTSRQTNFVLCVVSFEGLNDLYSLSNIVRVVKSRRMGWAGHVAPMGEERGVHRALVGKPEGKRP
jgi:hypothetical protein